LNKKEIFQKEKKTRIRTLLWEILFLSEKYRIGDKIPNYKNKNKKNREISFLNSIIMADV
jgi:hypothetical protein